MSLRFKLAINVSITILGIMILLSIGIFALVDHQFTSFFRNLLEAHSQAIQAQVNQGDLSNSTVGLNYTQTSLGIIHQVWNTDQELIAGDTSIIGFTSPLDKTGFIMEGSVSRKVEIDQQPYLVQTTPIETEVGTIGWIQVGLNFSRKYEALHRLIWSLLIADLLAGGLAWIICWLYLSTEFRDLKLMTRTAQSMIGGDDLITLDQLDLTSDNEITELAMALNQMYERIQSISRSQKQFLSAITHELRTPLTVLKGNIGLIRLMKKADEESLASMEKEIDRLIRLVNDLLLITQAEEGYIELKMVPFNFKELFGEIYNQLLVLDNDGHTIVMDQVEGAVITGDRDRLKQVLLNLGSNAIKFTPRGGKITLGMRKLNKEVCFWVSDTGQGIPEEELPHLFERFFKGRATKKLIYREGSFGLGLSIVSWILKQHKGRIEAESRVGEGTTFYVWLPLNESASN